MQADQNITTFETTIYTMHELHKNSPSRNPMMKLI